MSHLPAIRHAYEALLESDPGPLGVLFATDVRWYGAEGNPTAPPDGSALVGPDAIFLEVFARLAELWEGFRCTPLHLYDADDVVVAEVRYTAVSRSTGQTMDAQACHLWTFVDDKIVKFQQYVDTAQMQRVLDGRCGGSL